MGKGIEIKNDIETIAENVKPIKMQIEDLPQIADIFISYWGTQCLYSDFVFERIINQELSFVYKIEDEVIAFCLMEYDYKNDIINIDLLCVKKDYKGKHLGKSLLSFCINYSKDLKYTRFALHVSTTNIVAYNLYKKLGFVICEYIEKYYSDEKPEDSNAYYMILE